MRDDIYKELNWQLLKDKMENNKMTQEEAIFIANEIYSHNTAEEFINLLEKLGLLKFDVEKTVPTPASIIALAIRLKDYFPDAIVAEKIIDDLVKYGYAIKLLKNN